MTSSAGSVMGASSSPNNNTVIGRNGLESPIYARGATPSGRKRKASETPNTNNRPERRKITRACDSCKGKKTRCTGTLPCLRCTRLSLPCEYNAAYSRGLPPSPLPAPESMLRDVADSRNNSFSPAFTEKAPSTPATSSTSISRTCQSCSLLSSLSLKSERHSQFITPPPIISPHSSPELGSTTDLEGNYLGPTSGISFLNRVWRRLHLHQADDVDISTTIPPNPSPLQQHEAASTKRNNNTSVFMFGDKPFVDHHTEAGFVLLPLEKALELVGIYFDFSIVTYRFLHRGAVERWVREVYENNNVSSPMNLPSSSGRTLVARAAIVFMVFAVATMHEERRPGSTCATTGAGGDGDCEECNESERWYIASKHMSSLETGPPKLETLQARLGQCLYLLSSSRANECWYAFGTALQLVTALGLHRKRATTMKLGQTGTTTAYLEHELRKRVFWSAYTIDKYLSVMFGRPRLLHDEDIDQELPDVVDDDDIVMDSSPEPEMGVGLGLGLERQFSRHRQRQEVESADCLMIAANLHFRLARILSEISRQVYTIRPSSKSSASPLEAALHLTSELEKWKESVPPIFSSVRASSLIPPLCRQSHVLQLAYSHAVIHATRSFLLSDFTTAFGNRRGRGEEGGGGSTVTRDKVKIHVQKCISAAKDVMTLVVSLADQGILVQSFWFTHYVCFCAIIVVYIYTIQEYRRRPFLGTASAPSDDETATRSLFNLAESCQQHLAKATRRNCPSRRYSIILEELRVEVHRWIAAHDLRRSATGVGTDTAERITLRGAQHGVTVSERQQKASAPLETENQHPVSLESGNRPNHTPIPMPGELQLQAPVLEAIDDSGKVHDLNLVLPENWEESSTWWTQLDSWALSSIGNDASMFTF